MLNQKIEKLINTIDPDLLECWACRQHKPKEKFSRHYNLKQNNKIEFNIVCDKCLHYE